MKPLKPLMPPRWPGKDVPSRQSNLPLDPSVLIKRTLASVGLDRPAATNAERNRAALGRLSGIADAAFGKLARTGAADTQNFTSGMFDGPHGARAYKLFVPDGFAGKRLPLVVMLHGCKQDPDDFAAGTRMNTLAQTHGVIVLYPAQAPRSNAAKCWNWFNADDQRRDQGEPALLADMTRSISASHAVDPDRVYVAGLSAGGAMAAILGREYPDVFAAVGVHSGLPPGAALDVASAFAAMKSGDAPPTSGKASDGVRVPVIVFHGDRDATVHPDNGEHIVARVNRDAIELVEHGSAGHDYTRRSFVDATGRVVAEHWLVHGSDHAWSGGSADGSYADPLGPDASAQMLRFFLANSRVRS